MVIFLAKVEVEKDDVNKTIEISEVTNINNIKEKLGDCTIKRSDGSEVDNSLAKTGDRVIIGNDEYIVVKRGDCSGDGYVKASDYLMIKDFIMGTGTAKLQGAYEKAADVVKDNQTKASDYLKIKDHIMYGVEV